MTDSNAWLFYFYLIYNIIFTNVYESIFCLALPLPSCKLNLIMNGYISVTESCCLVNSIVKDVP